MGGKGSGRYHGSSPEASRSAAHMREKNPIQNPKADNEERNRETLQYVAALLALPPIDATDAEQIAARAGEWFALLDKYGMRPQVNALAMALGMDRRRLWEVVTDQPRGERLPQDARDSIKRLYQIIAIMNENALLETQGNPAALIFLAKNHHAYRDVQERQELHIRAEVDALPVAEIAERYRLQAGEPQGENMQK